MQSVLAVQVFLVVVGYAVNAEDVVVAAGVPSDRRGDGEAPEAVQRSVRGDEEQGGCCQGVLVRVRKFYYIICLVSLFHCSRCPTQGTKSLLHLFCFIVPLFRVP